MYIYIYIWLDLAGSEHVVTACDVGEMGNLFACASPCKVIPLVHALVVGVEQDHSKCSHCVFGCSVGGDALAHYLCCDKIGVAVRDITGDSYSPIHMCACIINKRCAHIASAVWGAIVTCRAQRKPKTRFCFPHHVRAEAELRKIIRRVWEAYDMFVESEGKASDEDTSSTTTTDSDTSQYLQFIVPFPYVPV